MDTKQKTSLGHFLSIITIIVWGTTFVSTKVLLRSFTPIEILFIRFLIGFVALILLYPHRLRIKDKKQEWLFAGAGITGLTLYYLLENIALTYTTASNISIIITIAPFFTALLSGLFLGSGKPSKQFYIGFIAAMIGVGLISYTGSSSFQLNPFGDLLAVLAAIAWAFYSIFTRKISDFGYNIIQSTRRIFFYGIMFMIPMLFFMDFSLDFTRFSNFVNLGNILFLGVGASAICFVTWNTAVGILGAVKTSVYIYLSPAVTVVFSVIILDEPLTPALVVGAILTLIGLWLSETKVFERYRKRSKTTNV